MLKLTAHSEPVLIQVDARDYGAAAHILRDLGVTSVAVMTANPAKLACLVAHGINVTEQLQPSTLASNGASQAAVAAAESTKKGPPRSSRSGSEPHFV